MNQMPEDKYKDIPLDEHVLHMWTPLAFDTPPGYDYLMKGRLRTFRYYLLRNIVALLLFPFNTLWYGLKIRGRKNLKTLGGTGYISVSNHVHPMDCTFVNLALFPKRLYYMTLPSNFKIPLIRRIIKVLGAVPIPTKLSSKKEMLAAMEKALNAGCAVHIYPEGILRPYYQSLRKCQSGAFNLAYNTGKPILPMVMTYRKPRGIYILKRKPCISLTVLEPIMPNKTAPKSEEVSRLQNLFEERIQDFIDAYKG